MSTKINFFDMQKEHSRVKTQIIIDFLKAYFPIILHSVGKNIDEIIYIDLYCGPGYYDNGDNSTPVLLLDYLYNAKNEDIRKKLQLIFNDNDKKNIDSLNEIIKNHKVTNKLKFKPIVTNLDAADVDIKVHINKKVPIFSFIDPFGYKSVSTEQIWDLIKNKGSDSVFFFNSDRILKDLRKIDRNHYFESIFGNHLTDVMEIVNIDSNIMKQKEKTQKFVEIFSLNLQNEMKKSLYNDSRNKLYLLPFSFDADDKEKTSHFILFITKHHKAIIEMKNVMVNHSNNVYGEQLGFDVKDSLLISFLNRNDFLDETIIKLIKTTLKNNLGYVDKDWTVKSLLEAIDAENTKINSLVTPCTIKEIKAIITKLDNKNFIEPDFDPKKNKIRITEDRKFKIKKELLV